MAALTDGNIYSQSGLEIGLPTGRRPGYKRLVSSGTRTCTCGRTISANKTTCKTCAEKTERKVNNEQLT